MRIRVKYLRDIDKIGKIDIGDWIDLRAGEDISLLKGEYYQIPLGVAIQLPSGTEALLVPRSSTFKKFGVIQTNSIGVIDNTYCGDNDEWSMPVLATRTTNIPKNTRICQFRVLPNMMLNEIIEVETLGNKDRKGFGSTGEI